jgi:hypothetical protein
VGLRDLMDQPDAAMAVCVHRLDAGAIGISVEPFPFPKREGQVRWFSSADPFDEMVVRMIVDGLAARADAMVGPEAIGYRLKPKPPGGVWAYRDLGRAHRRLRDQSARCIRSSDFECLLITDFRSCYHNVDHSLLAGLLLAAECKPGSVVALAECLTAFARKSDLRGLPIGLEAGGLLANVYLSPIDRGLAHGGLNFLHWGDDYSFFLSKAESVERTTELLNEHAHALGLAIAEDKTELIWDPDEALQRTKDRLLSYAQAALAGDPTEGLRMVYDMFEKEVASDHPDLSRFRFATRTLRNRRDPFALPSLARDRRLLALDPRTAGDYVEALTLADPRYGEPFFDVLNVRGSDGHDGVTVHVLRSLACRSWGHEEGEQFARVVRDAGRRNYVRGWAWQGLARTPIWRPDEAVEFVRSDPKPHRKVARGAVVALRHVPDSSARTSMLKAVEGADGEFLPTTHWISKAT